MPVYIPVNCFDVSFVHESTLLQQQAVVTIGLGDLSAPTAPDFGAVEIAWNAHMMPQISSGWKWTRAVWRTQAGAIRDAPKATVGSINSTALPPNCAVLVNKSTGQPGRKNRGRWYLPGPVQSGVNGAGMLTAGNVTDWQTAVNNFEIDCITADWQLLVLHRVATLNNVVGADPTPILGMVVQPQIATQRRRMRG